MGRLVSFSVLLSGVIFAVPSATSAQGPLRSPLVDVADAQVGADRVRVDVGLSGASSTLCLIDTGIDEAAFAESVVARFDALGAPLGHPMEAQFGGAVGGRSFDRRGHGTAMASIALTLAPDARIIVATAFDRDAGGFPDEAVVRAARFCRAVVESDPSLDPRRLVTLLSLGGHDGAHDGQSVFERQLTALADQPIVVAAGNDGERPVHAGGRILEGERAEVRVRVPRAGIDAPRVALSVHARTPSGFRLDVGGDSLEILRPGRQTHEVGGLEVTLEPAPERPEVTRIVLSPLAGTAPMAGTHTLTFEGPGDFDVWLAETRLGATFLPAALEGAWVHTAGRVTIPATAPGLIAVGASDVDRAEGVAEYSSAGPSAAGALVPDLVAPGGWMEVALSADLDQGDPDNLVGGRPELTTSGRVTIRGTSAAAAVVAGALLLALEHDPAMGPVARERLVASASDPSWTATRGWGELNVPGLVRGPQPNLTLQLIAARPLVPSDSVLHVGVRGRGTLRARVGEVERVAQLTSGATQLNFPVAGQTVGQPVPVQLWLDDVEATAVLVPVVLDRTRGVVPGGGCAVGGKSEPSSAWLGIAVVFTLRRRRLRLRGRG